MLRQWIFLILVGMQWLDRSAATIVVFPVPHFWRLKSWNNKSAVKPPLSSGDPSRVFSGEAMNRGGLPLLSSVFFPIPLADHSFASQEQSFWGFRRGKWEIPVLQSPEMAGYTAFPLPLASKLVFYQLRKYQIHLYQTHTRQRLNILLCISCATEHMDLEVCSNKTHYLNKS